MRLSDPVSRFIPEFKELKVAVAQPRPGQAGARGAAPPRFYTVPAALEITIRDLLTHTSGLVSGTISTAEAAKIARKPGETLAGYIPRLGQVPLEFQPGTRWKYSPGAGFDTLGRVVEIVSGQPFDQFLRQHIFEPWNEGHFLQYQRAAAISCGNDVSEDRQWAAESPNQPAANTTYFSGGGGFSSTADDYARFVQMLVNGGQLNGKRLLSPRTVELMGSPYAPQPAAKPGD